MSGRVKLIINSNVNDYINLIHKLRDLGISVGACEFDDPFDDPCMQEWIEQCMIACECDEIYAPCAGIMSGGFCDDLHFDDLDYENSSQENEA